MIQFISRKWKKYVTETASQKICIPGCKMPNYIAV